MKLNNQSARSLYNDTKFGMQKTCGQTEQIRCRTFFFFITDWSGCGTGMQLGRKDQKLVLILFLQDVAQTIRPHFETGASSGFASMCPLT